MTLQENIDAMTEIANTADKDIHVAKDALLSTIASNRTELMQLGQKMRTLPKYHQSTLSTFDAEYIALFMDAFRKVDALLTKVMTSGALDEGEFLCPEFEKIGIEYFPQGPVKKRIVVPYPEHDDVYSGEPVELRYAVSPSTTTDVPVSSWSSTFKQWIDTAALKCTKKDGKEYYMTADTSGWVKYFNILPVDSPAKAADGTGCGGYNFTTDSTITDPATGCTGNKDTMIRDGFSFVQFYDEDITEAYVSYSNFGQMLYKFNKFLMGYFGSKATTKGQDVLLQQFMRKAKDNDEAEQWADWFNDEAKEFSDTTAMSAALSTPRAVEHAASLYSVKFAIMKIMYGHARRLQFG